MTEPASRSRPPGADESRWRRINEIFHMALERAEPDRDRFLDDVGKSDPVLRDDVRSLLDAHLRAGEFMEGGIRPAQTPVVSLPVAPAPLTIGQYRIDGVLGSGGMGVVYLAYDTKLQCTVALKAISPHYVHDPTRRDRLRREARTAAALRHIPGIATVFALEEFGDEVFIATEYVPGETLREEINRGPATQVRAIETAVSIATALAAAHDRGVVHRDLKPENVMRTQDGGIKILDFGLALMPADAMDGARLTVTDRVIGTPAYMAPEQIRGETCDGRTDLFSFGILMFELTTGIHPFPGHDAASTIAKILETDPELPVPPPRQTDRGPEVELSAIIRRCLAKAPAARFSSAHEVLAALEFVRNGGSWREASRSTSPETAMRWWQFHQAATCVSYALLMLPLWWSRSSASSLIGVLIFVAGLTSTVAASVLRLNLWFTASSLPEEWRAQRAQSHPWLRVTESTLVVSLAVAGLLVLAAQVESRVALGATLLSAAVAVLLSFAVIEPATTRAAFRSRN